MRWKCGGSSAKQPNQVGDENHWTGRQLLRLASPLSFARGSPVVVGSSLALGRRAARPLARLRSPRLLATRSPQDRPACPRLACRLLLLASCSPQCSTLASHHTLASSLARLASSLVSSPPARSPHLLSSRSSPCSRTRLGRSRPSCEKKEWVKKKEWGVVSLEKLAVAPTSYGKKNLVSGGCNRHVRRCWCCHSDPDS